MDDEHATGADGPPQLPERPSRLPLVAVGVLIILAIGAALALGLGGAARFDEGTPEAAVQDYLDAALDGDRDGFLLTLDPTVRSSCEMETTYGLSVNTSAGFSLEDASVDGDTATIVLNERNTSGGPFGSTQRRGTQQVVLQRDDAGQWLVTEASWPFVAERCTSAAQ